MEEEIEKLKKRNKEIYDGFIATTQELCEATEDYKYIIKEVREWVHKTQLDNKRLEPIISTDELDDILEILDKEV